MAEYNSSEELQRHKHGAFVLETGGKTADKSEAERLQAALDAYIQTHSSTASVREIAKKNNRENGYQLDLSADIVLILNKIKKEIG